MFARDWGTSGKASALGNVTLMRRARIHPGTDNGKACRVRAGLKPYLFFLCRMRRRSFLYLCLRIFLRRFLTTLPTSTLLPSSYCFPLRVCL